MALNNLSTNINGNGQFYTAINNIVWIVSSTGNQLIVFDLDSLTFVQDSYTSIPQIPTATSSTVTWSSTNAINNCLTSFTNDRNNHYLVISGGQYCCVATGKLRGQILYSTQTEIFNISSDEWLNDVPNLQTPRAYHACIVHNGLLYVIGGMYQDMSITSSPTYYLSSIETLDLNIEVTDDIEYNHWLLTTKQWNHIQPLPTPLLKHRVVAYNSDILIIGGDTDNIDPAGYNNQIYVIDTNDGSISCQGSLFFAVHSASAITIYPYIYIFGGKTSTAVLNTVWYMTGPTIVPTNEPTNNPSLYPSLSPTSRPTISPTIKPTVPPTFEPTEIPTFEPTSTPSADPTQDPIGYPTIHPSTHPSRGPSQVNIQIHNAGTDETEKSALSWWFWLIIVLCICVLITISITLYFCFIHNGFCVHGNQNANYDAVDPEIEGMEEMIGR